jgi:hypothetical protein
MYASRLEFDAHPSAADRELIPPSTQRYAITFFPPRVGTVWWSTEVMSGPAQGFPHTAGQGIHRLCIDDDGDSVQRGWHAVYTAGAEGAAWIQVLGG